MRYAFCEEETSLICPGCKTEKHRFYGPNSICRLSDSNTHTYTILLKMQIQFVRGWKMCIKINNGIYFFAFEFVSQNYYSDEHGREEAPMLTTLIPAVKNTPIAMQSMGSLQSRVIALNQERIVLRINFTR